MCARWLKPIDVYVGVIEAGKDRRWKKFEISKPTLPLVFLQILTLSFKHLNRKRSPLREKNSTQKQQFLWWITKKLKSLKDIWNCFSFRSLVLKSNVRNYMYLKLRTCFVGFFSAAATCLKIYCKSIFFCNHEPPDLSNANKDSNEEVFRKSFFFQIMSSFQAPGLGFSLPWCHSFTCSRA